MDIFIFVACGTARCGRPRSLGTRASRILGANLLAHHSTARRAWLRVAPPDRLSALVANEASSKRAECIS
jgi:hypothetical protein